MADRVRRAELGFTLLEMLVALAVFSLAALALVRLQGVTLRTAADLDSKALGRSIREDETLKEAEVPLDDRLVLSPIVVAGAARVRTTTATRWHDFWSDQYVTIPAGTIGRLVDLHRWPLLDSERDALGRTLARERREGRDGAIVWLAGQGCEEEAQRRINKPLLEDVKTHY